MVKSRSSPSWQWGTCSNLWVLLCFVDGFAYNCLQVCEQRYKMSGPNFLTCARAIGGKGCQGNKFTTGDGNLMHRLGCMQCMMTEFVSAFWHIQSNKRKKMQGLVFRCFPVECGWLLKGWPTSSRSMDARHVPVNTQGTILYSGNMRYTMTWWYN